MGAVLVIRPNGTATFDANVWTHTHGTDVWHSTIHLLGPGGEFGNSGRHDSPTSGESQKPSNTGNAEVMQSSSPSSDAQALGIRSGRRSLRRPVPLSISTLSFPFL
jgi:hypothetical protein